MDSQFHNSLLWIKENEISADMELTFSTTQDIGGEVIKLIFVIRSAHLFLNYRF